MNRGRGLSKSDLERATTHFNVPIEKVTIGLVEQMKELPRGTGLRRGSARGSLSDVEVERIATAVVEKAAEDVGVRDIMIGSVMGKGAIPLYGRETRKEPCACCLIDPEGPNAPENRICTTKGAIGTLNDQEERGWCSEIKIVSDGRCARAMAIREAAKKCKEKHPDDTEAFFRCYIPAFSQITTEHLKRGEEVLAKGRETLERGREVLKGSNPGNPYPRSAIPEPYQREVRRELRKIPTWKLQEAYGKLKGGESTGVELMERNRAYATSAIEEILYERGKLEGGNPGLVGPIVAATVAMQKLEEEKKKPKDAGKMRF